MTQKEILQPYHHGQCAAGRTSDGPCTCGLWRAFVTAVKVTFGPAE